MSKKYKVLKGKKKGNSFTVFLETERGTLLHVHIFPVG